MLARLSPLWDIMFLYKFRFAFCLVCLIMVGIIGLSSCSASDFSAADKDNNAVNKTVPLSANQQNSYQTGRFVAVYEPSGILRLSDDEILVIEDEPRQAMSVLSFEENGSLSVIPIKTSRKHSPGRLEDLEGVASDGKGHYFAITSHSKTLRGRLPHTRKKLIRFKLDNYTMEDVAIITNLKKRILKKYNGISSAVSGVKTDFNIEALAYNRDKNNLMLGLRRPLIDGDAVIITITNPEQAFSKKEQVKFAKKLITLDLDKGGIRAISYDDRLGGYLIVSRREDKNKKPFKLWLWNGKKKHKPQPVRLNVDLDLDFAEGITPFSLKTQTGISKAETIKNGVFIVFDDGNALKSKGARYAFIPYENLKTGEP